MTRAHERPPDYAKFLRARTANDSKPQPYPAVSTGRGRHGGGFGAADAGSGGRPIASALVATGGRPLRRARARAAAGGWRGERQPGAARQSVVDVRPGRCRRGAKARSGRRAWGRYRGRARDLRGADPAGDGGDLSDSKPPPGGARTERAVSENPFSLWVYLSQSPLLWLTVTLLTYAIADAVSLATHRHPLTNRVLHSMWIIGAFLLLTGTSYTTYFGGPQLVHVLLGPATVALAVPLYEKRERGVAAILPMLAALVVRSVPAVLSAGVCGGAAGPSPR